MEAVGMNSNDSSDEEYFSADDEENIRSNKVTSRRSLQGSGKGKQAEPGNVLAFLADDHIKVKTVSEQVRLEPPHHEQADEQEESSNSMQGTMVAPARTESAPSVAVEEVTQTCLATLQVGEEGPKRVGEEGPKQVGEEGPKRVGEEGPTSPEPQAEETPPKPPPRKKKKRRDQEEEERGTSFGGGRHNMATGDHFRTDAVAGKSGGPDRSLEDEKVATLCVQPPAMTPATVVTTATMVSSSIPVITITNTTTPSNNTTPSNTITPSNTTLSNTTPSNTTLTKPPKPQRKHHLQAGISIEHDMQLELTVDMMCGSEVVTVDTTLAKAPGGEVDSNMAAVFIPSDDESTDGESLIVAEPSLTSTGTIAEEGVVSGGHASIRDSIGSTSTVVGPEEAGRSSPSDTQILQMTMVKNLDTGELIPLSAAEERIPRGWSNPLAEHLKQRTSELEGSTSGLQEEVGDVTGKRKPPITKKLKKIFKWKEEEQQGLSDDENEDHLKYKPSSHHKGPYEFDKVRLKQDLSGQHLGAVWVMEFSICGKLLATAGQDSVVRIWVLRTAYSFFHELQAKYQRMGVHSSGDSICEKESVASTNSSKSSEEDDPNSTKPFLDHPLCSYYGHTADVLGMSWSKNFFILSSSMDKTVRLWHISRKECLCCFQHVDFVTAIAFHPRDDRYFLSGSLDGKLRLWNIPDKKVALWNEIEGVGSHLITAANFCANGKFAVVGTYDGRCIFYDTEHLKYHTQIHVRSRHGKNRGRKISGVEPLPGENQVLVTSNDSRVRLYNLVDHSLTCKYKGGINTNSQIKATFSRDGQYIISGSEDKYIYIWRTHNDVIKLPSTRRDRSELYESFSCHSAPVTAAIFAPVPGITVDEGLREVGHIIVAADYQGSIKVYVTGEVL